MKTSRILLAAAALSGTALILSAAPDSRYNHTAPAPAKVFSNDRGQARQVKTTPAPVALASTDSVASNPVSHDRGQARQVAVPASAAADHMTAATCANCACCKKAS